MPRAGATRFNRAAEFTLALTLPAAVALVVIPVPIVAVLLPARRLRPRRYLARPRSRSAVYGAGLPAFVMQKVICSRSTSPARTPARRSATR